MAAPEKGQKEVRRAYGNASLVCSEYGCNFDLSLQDHGTLSLSAEWSLLFCCGSVGIHRETVVVCQLIVSKEALSNEPRIPTRLRCGDHLLRSQP